MADSSKRPEAAVRREAPEGHVKVLVALDRRADGELLGELERSVGLVMPNEIGRGTLLTAWIAPAQLDKLRAMPFVRDVEVERTVRLNRP